MTNRKAALWWVYVISGIALIFFLAPSLISAPDTLLVITGVVLLVLYVVWSWQLWGKSTAKSIKDHADDL